MITKVTGRRGLGPGALVDQLTFHTEKGHVFGPYGGSGGYSFTAKPPNSDCYLAWISGKVQNFVTTLLLSLQGPRRLSVQSKSALTERNMYAKKHLKVVLKS